MPPASTSCRMNLHDPTSLLASLALCAKKKDLFTATRLHADIRNAGSLRNFPHVASSLINMYAKCGALPEATQVLRGLPFRDTVCWSALIAGYAQQGLGHDAITCVQRMHVEGLLPDAVTMASILKACGSIRSVDKGKLVHCQIVCRRMLFKDTVLGTALVDMYSRCGFLSKAKQVLKEPPLKNVVSWSALMMGYVHHGCCDDVLNCYHEMRNEGLFPNGIAFICILKICGTMRAFAKGTRIHMEIITRGLLETDVSLGSALVDMYVKCGMLPKAQQVLEALPGRNEVTWSALIAGYAQQGLFHKALRCFQRMKTDGVLPNAVTFTCILNACSKVGALDMGQHIHDEISCLGLLKTDIVLSNALMNMYVRCGALAKGHDVLKEVPVRDAISWSQIIVGYVKQGQSAKALDCFEQMKNEGVSPDHVTYICVLKAYGNIGDKDEAMKIRDEIVNSCELERHTVLGTAMIDMCARCNMLAEAQELHERLPQRDVISWNTLLEGYNKHGKFRKTIDRFNQMQNEGLIPNAVSFEKISKAIS